MVHKGTVGIRPWLKITSKAKMRFLVALKIPDTVVLELFTVHVIL